VVGREEAKYLPRIWRSSVLKESREYAQYEYWKDNIFFNPKYSREKSEIILKGVSASV
jgi:hypothetical protein